jgi:hypothetical protein
MNINIINIKKYLENSIVKKEGTLKLDDSRDTKIIKAG